MIGYTPPQKIRDAEPHTHILPLFRALQQTFQSSTVFQTGAQPYVLVCQQFEPAVLDISLNTSCWIHYNSRLYNSPLL